MAAPLLIRNCTNLCKIRCLSTSCCSLINALATQESISVQYPPVKPRYPPGKWGDLSERTAWRYYEKSNEMLATPRVKDRLENFAGQYPKVLWIVDPMDRRPKNLQYRQWLTKTHIVSGFPDVYKSLANVDKTFESLKSVISDTIDLELEYQDRSKLETDVNGSEAIEQEWLVGHRLLGHIMNALSAKLAAENDQLLHSQLDEDVRIESFWFAGRFNGEGYKSKGKFNFLTKDDKSSMLLFQSRHKADWQIRTEKPLPAFVDMDASVCRDGPVPSLNFTPTTCGLSYVHDRPINVSGYWIGDPCEFSLLSLNLLPPSSYKIVAALGEKHALESQFNFGMTAAFGSCLAQAHNQGFSYLHDLTYPLTTQCLVTDGKSLRLFAYQLNTLRIWLEDGPNGNPLRNLVWATDPIPLFDGDSRRPNDEAFKLMLKCLLLHPVDDASVNLRPFLPDEEAPVKQSVYMNHKGEPPMPYTPPERYQFPKNAVYY